MRNPHIVIGRWPQLAGVMGGVFEVLLAERSRSADLCNLRRAFGPTPRRAPPASHSIGSLRAAVAVHLGLHPEEAESRHPASPLQSEIFAAIGTAVADPDQSVPRWLREGAPMGILRPIHPGGLFPLVDEQSSLAPDEFADVFVDRPNHRSFAHGGEDEASSPAAALVAKAVDSGFGMLFQDVPAAEHYLGTRILPSPLGDVVKACSEGGLKHRIIQDLKISGVNSLVTLPERQVLPRAADHARAAAELLSLQRPGESLETAILNFADAYMSVPLHRAELPFNAAVIADGIQRTRPPVYPGEPSEGSLVLWRVLGFGGRPNPLVYTRIASVGARTAAALRPPYRDSSTAGGLLRLQLYVDDTALSLLGNEMQRGEMLDAVLL